MIRDILISTVLVSAVLAGLWLFGLGRETMSSLYLRVAGGKMTASAPDDSGDIAAMFSDGSVWCYWPDQGGRCAWAMAAAEPPNLEGFDVAIYAIERRLTRGGKTVAEISVAKTGLALKDGLLCDDPSRPTTRARLSFYTDARGVLNRTAALRSATGEEYSAYRAAVGAPVPGAITCFSLSRDGDVWRQKLVNDDAASDQFTVLREVGEILLAPPD